MIPFDPRGPLPSGTWSLEASAGTGKTHTIAALVARFLAEGKVVAKHLAVVTFSRAAAGELRDRIRSRLSSSAEALRRELAGSAHPVLDATDEWLCQGEPRLLEQRLTLLDTALAEFDAAQVATIHEFCEAMLTELGVLATADPQAQLVHDLSQLRSQVVRDVYLRRFAQLAQPPFKLKVADEIAAAATEVPDARLVPDDGNDPRVSFATEVRTVLEERKRQLGLYSYNDQLLRLLECVRPDSATAARQRLRERFRLVLVDEFQDTDPIQWEILKTCFHQHSTLVLIGDPKQAIYSFRGADINTYQAATALADARRSLLVNHRSDRTLVEAVNSVFHNAMLAQDIQVPEVSAEQPTARIRGVDAWLQLRVVAPDKTLVAATAREKIWDDLATVVVKLLAEAELLDGERWRRLRGSDIAVLVRTNDYGRSVAERLSRAGLAVALPGADSVFTSKAAQGWLHLLTALDKPQRPNIRRAMFTDFIGATLPEVAAADDDRFAAWSTLLADWGKVLASDGVAAAFGAIQSTTDFVARLAARQLGERDLTDYRHLSALLHAQYVSGTRGPALTKWLADSMSAAGSNDEWIRKLDTDQDAVQVLTVHRAKGLQFPVVLLPQVADHFVAWDDDRPFTTHDDSGLRVTDVGLPNGQGRSARRARYRDEQAADDLRQFYVGMTRAQSALILWWARTRGTTPSSALQRMLFRRRDTWSVPRNKYPVDMPPGDGDPRCLDWLAKPGISVQEVAEAPPALHQNPALARLPLQVAQFNRPIDQRWHRTSYSGLTSGAHESVELPEHLLDAADSEAEAEVEVDPAAESPLSPMAGLPAGAAFGTVVHEIFEYLDWHTADDAVLLNRLEQACAEAMRRSPLRGFSAAGLAAALLPALRTDLGELTGGLSLSAIAGADRLAELDFEFPLGDRHTTTTLADVGALLRKWLPADDPLADYPERLADPGLQSQLLRGFLTGSIDSVLRIGERHLVVDYKTNWLGGHPLTLQHYARPAMATAMMASHYPLQALLYCVALHRFLGNRLAGYRPERHLGPVGYLFVRGMSGAQPFLFDGHPSGVFTWHPPAGLIIALSELLEDRRPG